ncbi:uncharacterized protein LY89DRAFT_707346 [Mollisia scopiformis]|uniref:SH3 domain-containing protein n=1 Tax=Mollisia scopiformis TaxID=149040 RepID=A0A194XB11_MOLSC|nr:uncharacterized protein LY89DRAFT_707346 [Mollisia scopiformis]KUJ16937.1 hypothetical protein LY89DRAFT_707346 [Mollisia scopiformis]
MVSHDHLHRRHARAADPFAAAWAEAEAIANALANPNPAQSTVVSVVYVTASPTFTGAIGGYTTLGVAIDTDTDTDTTTSTTPATTAAGKTSSTGLLADTSSTKATTKSQTTLATSISTLPSSIASPSTSAASSIGILAATSALSSTTTSQATATHALAASSTATSETATSSGMSTAGKAGLAIGILLLVGAVLAMVLFCFKRRREAAAQKIPDEKHDLVEVTPQASQFNRHNSTATNATTRTQATAPRLSLRPVTQFLPNLAEKRVSKGNALNMGNDGWQKPKDNDANKDNPFGNHAETIDTTNANGPGLVRGVSPAGDVVLADPLASAAPVGLKRGASKRDLGDKALDFTRSGPFLGPPSPAGTEFSMSSDAGTPVQTATSVAIAAAGGPANSAVHRVQLDFVPSMGDELELKAGQLVRVLHEFDDGWAMCIRLDRSQQGVCPRTCLSARPVKPRPQNAPGARGPAPGPRNPGPQGRPMPPNGQGRPMTPNSQAPRPMTPNGQAPRPMTPNGNSMTPQGLQPRPMTPTGPLPGTPNQRPRSNSAASAQAKRNSPPGPSPMKPIPQFDGPASPPTDSPISRKPVPGQAL